MRNMKIKNLLSLVLILIGIGTSYSQEPVYSFKNSTYLDDEYQKSIELYTMESTNDSHKLDRKNFIDEIARKRLSYYLDLIKESTKYRDSKEVVISMRGERGHSRLCGYNDGTLIEPRGCVYPGLDYIKSSLAAKGLKYGGEIYQISSKIGMTSKTELSDTEAVWRVLNEYTSKRLKKWGGKIFTVDKYLESPEHKDIIDEYGKGAYGFNNGILVRKYRKNGLWAYDVFVMNLTIFTY
jgi:hypothetical protein